MGAAGVPQPLTANTIASPMASATGGAAHPRLFAVLIALPVYWSGAGRETQPRRLAARACALSMPASRGEGAMLLLAAKLASAMNLIRQKYRDEAPLVAVPATHGILQEEQPSEIQ